MITALTLYFTSCRKELSNFTKDSRQINKSSYQLLSNYIIRCVIWRKASILNLKVRSRFLNWSSLCRFMSKIYAGRIYMIPLFFQIIIIRTKSSLLKLRIKNRKWVFGLKRGQNFNKIVGSWQINKYQNKLASYNSISMKDKSIKKLNLRELILIVMWYI